MKLYLIGLMGCGKTYYGEMLSRTMLLPHYDLDEEIEKSSDKSISDIFKDDGESTFREKEKAVLEALTDQNPDFVLSCGGGTPCFPDNMNFMTDHGKVVYLKSSVLYLYYRLHSEKAERPLIADLSDNELRVRLSELLNEREPVYEKAHYVIDVDELSDNEVLEKIDQIIKAS